MPHTRRALTCGAMLLFTAAAAGCGDDAEPAPTASIVYEEFPDNTVGRIVRIAADGSHRQVLWEGGIYITRLYPSPDGRNLLFLDYEIGQWYLLPAAGGTPVPFALPVSGEAYGTEPVWAPDGSAIAWLINDPSPLYWRVAVALPGSSSAQFVSPEGLNAAWVDWSPDSQQLTFCTRSISAVLLHVVDRDGGNLHAITTDTLAIDCHQAWSPAPQIAIPGGGLYTVHPDGSDLRLIGLNPPGAISFVGPLYWSPDARHLAATAENGFLWRVDAMTGANTWLRVRATSSNPWSPDGSSLLYLGDTTQVIDGATVNRPTVGVMRSDGTGRRTVTPDTVSSYFPVWLADPS